MFIFFLPAAGCRVGTGNNRKEMYGDYWSSSLFESEQISAHGFYFDVTATPNVATDVKPRYEACPIRAVLNESQEN